MKNSSDINNIETKNHRTAKIILRIIGFILLPIGLTLSIIGLVSFFESANSLGQQKPELFYMLFIGGPLVFIGLACLFISFMKNISSFTASQTAPVAKNVANYIIDGTSDSLSNAASKVFDKIKNNDVKPVCPKCGEVNEIGAKFCDKCGSKLFKTCPKCGEVNDPDSSFCRKCGNKL